MTKRIVAFSTWPAILVCLVELPGCGCPDGEVYNDAVTGCAPPGAEGDVCEEDEDCAQGLTCWGFPKGVLSEHLGGDLRHCGYPPGKLGEPCATEGTAYPDQDAFRQPYCADGLVCRLDPEAIEIEVSAPPAEPPEPRASPGDPVPDGGVTGGPRFFSDTGECLRYESLDAGFFCRDPDLTEAGDYCAFGPDDCGPEMVCNLAFRPHPQCRPPSADGGPCWEDDECEAGLTCQTVEPEFVSTCAESPECVKTFDCDPRTEADCNYWVSCDRECHAAE